MKSIIQESIARLFPEQTLKYHAFNLLIRNKNSYLYTVGWMQSLDSQTPMNRNKSPIPWMNYPVIALLEERLSNDLNLFEYGSGYSTLFYANKVKSVVSVEYDESWFHNMKSQVPENVSLIFQEKDINGKYCRVINSTADQFDVVIVDGRDRVNCVMKSMSALSKRGVILLDDSQRESYQEAISLAVKNGFKALNLEGLKPTGTGIDRTTIFYKEGNCLGI